MVTKNYKVILPYLDPFVNPLYLVVFRRSLPEIVDSLHFLRKYSCFFLFRNFLQKFHFPR